MRRIKIKHRDGFKVHFQNPVDGEYTLCGREWTESNYDAGWKAGKGTSQRVTCDACQSIVKACKQVNDQREISPIGR